MKRYLWILLTAVSALLLAAPAFAQGASEAAGGRVDTHWIWIASGFSMAIASAGCAYAQGKAAAAACEGLGRNPGARPAIQLALILSLVFIESLALYTLIIVYTKVAL